MLTLNVCELMMTIDKFGMSDYMGYCLKLHTILAISEYNISIEIIQITYKK